MVFLYFCNLGFDFAYLGFDFAYLGFDFAYLGFNFKLTVWDIGGSYAFFDLQLFFFELKENLA